MHRQWNSTVLDFSDVLETDGAGSPRVNYAKLRTRPLFGRGAADWQGGLRSADSSAWKDWNAQAARPVPASPRASEPRPPSLRAQPTPGGYRAAAANIENEKRLSAAADEMAVKLKMRIEARYANLRKALSDIDHDHSGTITVAELENALAKWAMASGSQVERAALSRLVASADLNNDGAIDYAEFCSFVSKRDADLFGVGDADDVVGVRRNAARDGGALFLNENAVRYNRQTQYVPGERPKHSV